MTDRPIPFTAAMVRALLAGTKTQTRRLLKLPKWAAHPPEFEHDELGVSAICEATGCFADLPICRIGDRAYVREEYYQQGYWSVQPRPRGTTDKERWRFVPDGEPTFEAPAEFRKGRHHKDPWTVAWHKRLGRFMPRTYSRLTLLVTDVRVERLQNISEVDAIAEGVRVDSIPDGLIPGGHTGYGFDGYSGFPTATSAYAVLWDLINGPGSWAANPWVCAISFTVHRHNIDKVPHA